MRKPDLVGTKRNFNVQLTSITSILRYLDKKNNVLRLGSKVMQYVPAVLEILTILPFAFSNKGSIILVVRTVPQKLTSITFSKSSIDCQLILPSFWIPALLTTAYSPEMAEKINSEKGKF